MPLSHADLEEIQAEAMADDVAIDLDNMSLWTREQAVAFFESGGVDEPAVDVSEGTVSGGGPSKSFPPLAPRSELARPRDYSDFEKHQNLTMKGDTFHLEFPYSAAMLKDENKFGSRWLTEAFRAFGSISETNAVHIVSVEPFVGGGAASKAKLTVRYDQPESDRPEGGLQTLLFVKMPHEQARPPLALAH